MEAELDIVPRDPVSFEKSNIQTVSVNITDSEYFCAQNKVRS